jgi:hypothetical protein
MRGSFRLISGLIDSTLPALRLRPRFARLCRTTPAGSIRSYPNSLTAILRGSFCLSGCIPARRILNFEPVFLKAGLLLGVW